MAFLHRISLWSSWQCLEPLEGGRQVGWGGSEEGTTGTRPKSPPCPISKHRQQQMLSSVSHARKQRKALTKMRESAWLPRPLKGKKKIPPHQAHTKTPPAAQKNSNPPEPAAPHPPASRSGIRSSSFQHRGCPGSPTPGGLGAPRIEMCLGSHFSPCLHRGAAESVLTPTCPFFGNHTLQGTAKGLMGLKHSNRRGSGIPVPGSTTPQHCLCSLWRRWSSLSHHS